jgi:hypothetical protein
VLEKSEKAVLFVLVAAVLWITSCGSAAHSPGSGSFSGKSALLSAPETYGVAGVNLSRSQVSGGDSLSMSVSLAAPAPEGGLTVQLKSSDVATASVPATVLIPAGESSATMAVVTYAVSNSTTVSIAAISGRSMAASALSVVSATTALFSVSVSPSVTTIADGQSESVKLTTKVAPGFNHSVQLSVSNVPSGVSVKFSPAVIPAPGAGTSKVSIAVGRATATGTHSIHLKAIDGTATTSTALTLKIAVNPDARFQGCWYQTNGHRYQGVVVSVENPGSYPLDAELYYGTACDPNTLADEIGFGTDVNFGDFDWIFYFDAFADQSNMSTRWHVGPDTSACFAYTSATPTCP